MRLFQNTAPCTSLAAWVALNIIGRCGLVSAAVVPIASSVIVSSVIASSATAVTTRPESTATATSTGGQATTTNAEALRNLQWYDDKTIRMFDRSKFDKENITYARKGPVTGEGTIDHETVTYFRNGTVKGPYGSDGKKIKKDIGKRSDPWEYYDWAASGFCEDDWGYWLNWFHECCRDGDHYDYTYGHIMRAVVTNANRNAYKYWYNESWTYTYRSSGDTQCSLYESPWDEQPTTWIWNPTAVDWEEESSYNTGLGWTTNNATYHGHTVRTIWDGLLDRLAIQYNTVVTAFGKKPVQYTMSGMKYYRFYDSNNFAWFVACPPNWPGAWKRQNLHGRNTNPVWDFGPPPQRDWATDITPFPEDLIYDYNDHTTYTAMFWPDDTDQNVTVDGHTCQRFAASRPGLRHWTAKLIDIPPLGYPPITEEWYYPDGWDDYDMYALSIDDSGFSWSL